MLASSRRATPVGSGRGTPSFGPQRFYQPALRSSRSREVSGTQPPANAEFVASEPAPSSGKGISSSAFSPGYFKQFFREERELGRGGNGVVLLVEHVLDGVSLGHFACKRIPVGNDHQWLEKVLVEVKLLAQVPHQNLVKYHWVWVEEHQPASFGPSVPCVWILQEYCNGGDLHNYVLGPREDTSTAEKLKARHRKQSMSGNSPVKDLRRQSRLTLEEIFSFFRDITSGLHHLHAKGYIHRDVKPSNCLLQQSEGRIRVLLSDFGEVQATGTRRGNTGATGTISYCAPEVLRQEHDGSYGNFTTKSDIFSLGMIVYFMCFGRLPYVNADDFDEDNEDLDLLRAEITAWRGFDDKSRSRDDLPERLYKYLQRLLSVDPLERPSTDDILTSIKASTGFGDVTAWMDDTRVTSVDSPRKGSRSRKASYVDAAYGTLHRSLSSDKVRRSPSPIKKHVDESDASGIVLRPRKLERPQSRPPNPPISPQLMLPAPPPPATLTSRFLQMMRHPVLQSLWFRAAIFVVKIVVLLYPCGHYAPNPILLYPLILLASADLAIEPHDLRRSSLTATIHLLVIWWTSRAGTLCCNAEDLDAWEMSRAYAW
ncbi:hypothetical protein AMS68_007499 [Peltaster fructicola]|uniref:non-specific serine/threonine protein kinase n=1 Tax=Peltaster fructicola TaxID=286661 RepID=A0A6H0Y4M7_9PEZI|nr:hypothetical protein AMS68_007499 [Peltaster fructicola]